jgi:hypothetical protein
MTALSTAAYASNPDDDLLIYAVNIHQTPMQKWGPGYGIYLGHGLFITAAHVAGHSWWTHPKVAIGGREFPTTVIKEGSFEDVDLTLLAVKQDLLPVSLQLRLNPLCAGPLIPGTEVITVVPEGIARSRIISPELIPRGARRFSTAIADVAKTGNSGSGVFDARRHCLLGIMSRKIMQPIPASHGKPARMRDVAKYFVPSTTIRAFLPADIKY